MACLLGGRALDKAAVSGKGPVVSRTQVEETKAFLGIMPLFLCICIYQVGVLLGGGRGGAGLNPGLWPAGWDACQGCCRLLILLVSVACWPCLVHMWCVQTAGVCAVEVPPDCADMELCQMCLMPVALL